MPLRWDPREHFALLAYLAKWAALVAPVAVVTGSAVALFLWALERATELRWANPWLMLLLPVAGIGIVALYRFVGGDSDRGNNLVMEQIHEPGGGVPRRMAPLILLTTVLTHLFGGSAGREGTAVQMGGSIASGLGRMLNLNARDTRILLSAGVAAGFGAVFGTPLTGAVFALEVLALGTMRYDALIPCLMASLAGDRVCAWWGIPHTHYHIAVPELAVAATHAPVALDPVLGGKVALAALLFGLASVLFAESIHGLTAAWKRYVPVWWMRPVLGASMVLGISWALGTTDYLGLGVRTATGEGTSIVNAFHEGGATPFSWFWKSLLTAITLSCGFKGGEVTPLFFVGATLGCALAGPLGVPVDLMAGLGFIAVFAGATNTPLACTLMGVELFGSTYLLYFAIACFVAYFISGHSGIYGAQRVGAPKGDAASGDTALSLAHLRERRRRFPWGRVSE